MKNKVKQAVVMKIALYCAPLLVILIPVLLIIALTMNNPSVVCQTDTTTTTTSSDSGSSNGSLTDKNSDIGKRVSYIIDRFKKAGYSGDNISAIIAIGWRESNLNPKAVNPAGSVKGIWQWGAGGINGNRYQNTADTVEAQVDLAFKELASSHIVARLGLANAKDIDSSALAWDTGFEGVGASDPQRKVSEVNAWAESIKKTYDLNFEGSLSSGNNAVSDSNTSASNSADSDSNNQSAYCNTDDSGSADGAGKIKESGLLFWDKNSIPDDIKPYVHNITSKKLDWRLTTPDAYNQCAGFSQVYMNAIWSPNFTFRGNGNVTAEAVAKVTGVKVTTTPKAGAVFSSDRPNHTGVVLHVLANGDLIIANQNAVKSGQNAGTSKDYEMTLVPKKSYAKDSQAVGYGDMAFAYPGDNSKYKLHW
ncbi:CHAP domain-containing protein [Leuconostoc mesenteroides]|uniref:phage tail tip lysozyme n=1 Tax=Leuconostoc mesenteroides TaxID=1245 RepID=UPI001CC016AA|nr:CHAP domain-containing protein [Leuconostoc mesenteroides]